MENKSIAIVGLGFGDEGKGQFTNYLANKLYPKGYGIFEKCVGGCQGKHSVVLENGKYFSFAQLSPGILKEKTINILGKGFVFDPFALIDEVNLLSNITNKAPQYYFSKIYIDNNAVCVTPIHKIYNVAEEENIGVRGSVGTGVSIAGLFSRESMTLYAKDIFDVYKVRNKITAQITEFSKLAKTLGFKLNKLTLFDMKDYTNALQTLVQNGILQITNTQNLHFNNTLSIYESSQGILIDKDFGIRPNITYLNVNPTKEIIGEEFEKIGIIRSIYTRHGEGSFPTEEAILKDIFKDINQEVGRFSGSLRFGWFDLVLFKYALKMTNVDSIYMSCLDYLDALKSIKICNGYIYKGTTNQNFRELFDCEIIDDDIKLFGPHKIKINGIKKNDDHLKQYLELCEPIYETINLEDKLLDEKIEIYIEHIEKSIAKKIDVISTSDNISGIIERTKK